MNTAGAAGGSPEWVVTTEFDDQGFVFADVAAGDAVLYEQTSELLPAPRLPERGFPPLEDSGPLSGAEVHRVEESLTCLSARAETVEILHEIRWPAAGRHVAGRILVVRRRDGRVLAATGSLDGSPFAEMALRERMRPPVEETIPKLTRIVAVCRGVLVEGRTCDQVDFDTTSEDRDSCRRARIWISPEVAFPMSPRRLESPPPAPRRITAGDFRPGGIVRAVASSHLRRITRTLFSSRRGKWG